jgi:hypothetical protein
MDFVKWRPVFTFYAAENCHMMSRFSVSAKVIDVDWGFDRRKCELTWRRRSGASKTNTYDRQIPN